ncbi:MAG TPA: hypothetical protein VMA72_11900 [Streptosporangiaceae bacterium]|nr:hypothetical protein [Streptosporangiaceae bacterium]
MSPHALAGAASVMNLNHPGTYLSWSFIDISVASLIGVMVVIFGLALLVPFPGRHAAQPASAGTLAGGPDTGAAGLAAADTPTLTVAPATTPVPACGLPGCGDFARIIPASQSGPFGR